MSAGEDFLFLVDLFLQLREASSAYDALAFYTHDRIHCDDFAWMAFLCIVTLELIIVGCIVALIGLPCLSIKTSILLYSSITRSEVAICLLAGLYALSCVAKHASEDT